MSNDRMLAEHEIRLVMLQNRVDALENRLALQKQPAQAPIRERAVSDDAISLAVQEWRMDRAQGRSLETSMRRAIEVALRESHQKQFEPETLLRVGADNELANKMQEAFSYPTARVSVRVIGGPLDGTYAPLDTPIAGYELIYELEPGRHVFRWREAPKGGRA